MPPPPHTKPENVLKRAQELIGVGNKADALHTLHEHVTSKRTRNSPIAALEPVMLLFIELCVELRKGKMAKDGLYNYKNTSQNTNVATIELVFRKFIELAEQKVTEAQAKADEVTSEADREKALANVGDLEASETPESILLSTVSGEQSKDRTDRAIVTPWLKFLWETYRTVLDIFKNNARLEVMYQTTAHQAFQFCLKYARKTEFRRLCELLRNHLQNAAKYSSQMHAINLSDPDTLQRHLDTRFEQLNVAVELELWQEAFKSVEDTHTLLSLSKRPAKNSMMANYFEKLTRIFMVSENYLFHAAAWSRYYNLLRQSAMLVGSGQGQKKDNPTNIAESDLTTAASFVVLSALAIPVISTSRSRGALVDIDEARKNKNARLTNLLGMSSPPSRAILFKDALNKGLLRRARPEIRELYNILEVEFHPLSICKRISPILGQIGADPEMQKYVAPLQQVILTRLFQQLSQVYETVELNFVLGLAQFPEPFELSRSTIEKFIMNGCKKGDLAIRVDHATGVLTFDNDVFSSAKASQPGTSAGSAEVSRVQRLQSTPAEIVRSQLTRLTKALYVTCQYVDPSFNQERVAAKQAALARAAAGAETENREALARREIIQKKKESAANALAAREREEAQRKRMRAQQLQEQETQRLAEEQKDREQRRLKAEQQRVQREEIQKQLKDMQATGIKGVDLDKLDIDELDSARIRQLKLQALEKEKNEVSDKLRITAKRIDHLERAYRKEEIKLLPEDYKKQIDADRQAYEKSKAETLEEAKAKHASDVELKTRLSRLVPAYEQYRRTVTEQRHAEFERRRKDAERELNKKIDQRRREVRERRERERRQAEEDERIRREEEERERVEAEQREREEAEKRERLEREKAERAKSREEARAAAELQLKREEEAERRRAERKGGAAPSRGFERPTERAEPSAGGPPRLALAGNKPTWREREAARQAAGGDAPTNGASAAPSRAPEPERERERPAPAEPAPLRKGGYVPPHLREGASRPAGEAPPAMSREDSRGEGSRPEARRAAPSGDKWQPRSRGADAGDRSSSPATAGTPPPRGAYRPPGSRSDQPAEGRQASSGGSGGAYRPGAFSSRRKE
ncbi:eukaryotic translation initiation factor 3 subunit A [Elsinoe australis]|uniref:Eukaryotic translation initiation factor 3 subunit A n=1 Tax=Elsinoe australis TaxID=40998 RepID=A0A4U7BEN0_9PEZI|nr:eukaryotic translation initiation factor 3 subunit A [Elsinoe australis]